MAITKIQAESMNLADTYDFTGTVSGAADLSSLNATNLTSGTIPDARFPSTLPALNGSALTNISSIGVGQTWSSVSRSANVTYTNNSGRAIAMRLAYHSGLSVLFFNGTDTGYWDYGISFIVPNGSSWEVNALTYAWELS
jgi:hypothetical protein